MLHEAVEKVYARERGSSDGLGFVVAIPERHLCVVDPFEATVTDRDTEEIARQIVEHARAIASGLGVHDPRCGPHRR